MENKTIEESPQKRFQKLNTLIGHGSYKRVYNSFDQLNGHYVAWSDIPIAGISNKEKKRFLNELQILKKIKHKNLINYLASWYNEEQEKIVLITELVSSGALDKYIKERPITIAIIKNWSKQILCGLNYLHTLDPPIIHRDIKCSNIFWDSQQSLIKIGDLGVSVVSNSDAKMSIAGTPEFMAPEMFAGEIYNTKADIYAFGMCLLEMYTQEIPFSECLSIPDIYRKGQMPDCLDKIRDDKTKQFIKKLLSRDPDDRPTAASLLKDPFFEIEPSDSKIIYDPSKKVVEDADLEMSLKRMTKNDGIFTEENSPIVPSETKEVNPSENITVHSHPQDPPSSNSEPDIQYPPNLGHLAFDGPAAPQSFNSLSEIDDLETVKNVSLYSPSETHTSNGSTKSNSMQVGLSLEELQDNTLNKSNSSEIHFSPITNTISSLSPPPSLNIVPDLSPIESQQPSISSISVGTNRVSIEGSCTLESQISPGSDVSPPSQIIIPYTPCALDANGNCKLPPSDITSSPIQSPQQVNQYSPNTTHILSDSQQNQDFEASFEERTVSSSVPQTVISSSTIDKTEDSNMSMPLDTSVEQEIKKEEMKNPSLIPVSSPLPPQSTSTSPISSSDPHIFTAISPNSFPSLIPERIDQPISSITYSTNISTESNNSHEDSTELQQTYPSSSSYEEKGVDISTSQKTTLPNQISLDLHGTSSSQNIQTHSSIPSYQETNINQDTTSSNSQSNSAIPIISDLDHPYPPPSPMGIVSQDSAEPLPYTNTSPEDSVQESHIQPNEDKDIHNVHPYEQPVSQNMYNPNPPVASIVPDPSTLSEMPHMTSHPVIQEYTNNEQPNNSHDEIPSGRRSSFSHNIVSSGLETYAMPSPSNSHHKASNSETSNLGVPSPKLAGEVFNHQSNTITTPRTNIISSPASDIPSISLPSTPRNSQTLQNSNLFLPQQSEIYGSVPISSTPLFPGGLSNQGTNLMSSLPVPILSTSGNPTSEAIHHSPLQNPVQQPQVVQNYTNVSEIETPGEPIETSNVPVNYVESSIPLPTQLQTAPISHGHTLTEIHSSNQEQLRIQRTNTYSHFPLTSSIRSESSDNNFFEHRGSFASMPQDHATTTNNENYPSTGGVLNQPISYEPSYPQRFEAPIPSVQEEQQMNSGPESFPYNQDYIPVAIPIHPVSPTSGPGKDVYIPPSDLYNSQPPKKGPVSVNQIPTTIPIQGKAPTPAYPVSEIKPAINHVNESNMVPDMTGSHPLPSNSSSYVEPIENRSIEGRKESVHESNTSVPKENTRSSSISRSSSVKDNNYTPLASSVSQDKEIDLAACIMYYLDMKNIKQVDPLSFTGSDEATCRYKVDFTSTLTRDQSCKTVTFQFAVLYNASSSIYKIFISIIPNQSEEQRCYNVNCSLRSNSDMMSPLISELTKASKSGFIEEMYVCPVLCIIKELIRKLNIHLHIQSYY